MDVDQVDVVVSLTQQGPHFQDAWSKFMFNIEKALDIKKKNVTKDKILEMLQAGSLYLGGGWTTGSASKKLYDLSGVAIVKSQIEPYRDTWLYCLALLLGVDLPTVDLPGDCAEAAFALAHHYDNREDQAHEQVDDTDGESEDELTFPWDEQCLPLPKQLMALWNRAADPEQKIAVKALFFPLLVCYRVFFTGAPGPRCYKLRYAQTMVQS